MTIESDDEQISPIGSGDREGEKRSDTPETDGLEAPRTPVLSSIGILIQSPGETQPPLTADELKEVYKETIEKGATSFRKKVLKIDENGVEIEVSVDPEKHVRFSDKVFVFFSTDDKIPYDDSLHLVPTQKWIEKMKGEKHKLRQTRIQVEMKRATKEQELKQSKSKSKISCRPSISSILNKIRLNFQRNPPPDDYSIDGVVPPKKISMPRDLPDSAPKFSHIMVAMASNVNAIEAFIPRGLSVTLGTIHREIAFKTPISNPARFGENVNPISEKIWLYIFMVSQILRDNQTEEKKNYLEKFRHTSRRRVENILLEVEAIKANLQRYFGTLILFKWRILSAFLQITKNPVIDYKIDIAQTLYPDKMLHLTGLNVDGRPLKRNVKVEYKRVPKRDINRTRTSIDIKKSSITPSSIPPRTSPVPDTKNPSRNFPFPPQALNIEAIWCNFYEMSLETQSIILLDEWPKNILGILQKLHRFLLFLTEDLINERFERHQHKTSQLFKSLCNCIKLLYKDRTLRSGDLRLMVEWSHYIFNSIGDFIKESDKFCRQVLDIIEITYVAVDYLRAEPYRLDIIEPSFDVGMFYDTSLHADSDSKISDRLLSSASLTLKSQSVRGVRNPGLKIKKLSKNDFFCTDYHTILKEIPVQFGRSSSPEFRLRF